MAKDKVDLSAIHLGIKGHFARLKIRREKMGLDPSANVMNPCGNLSPWLYVNPRRIGFANHGFAIDVDDGKIPVAVDGR